MKKFLLSLFMLFVLSVSAVYAENIKFVQITDAHFSSGSEYAQNVLKAAVADINSLEGISFVVFTGDNINTADSQNLKQFVRIVKKLKYPYYIVLGNHDVYKSNDMSSTRYYEILRSENIRFRQKKPNYMFKKNGFVFLTVNGAKEIIPGASGYYKKDTLEWVDKMLAKNKKREVIIFQHFPVVYPKGDEHRLKTHKTYKVEEYRDILAKHQNVLAVLSGHFHVNYESMQDGVYHISTPSLLNMPNSYKIIDIVTTPEFSPIIYTQLREFEVKN